MVPEEDPCVDQKRMSETEAEKETDSLHDDEEGRITTRKMETVQETKKKATPKMKAKSKASEPV